MQDAPRPQEALGARAAGDVGDVAGAQGTPHAPTPTESAMQESWRRASATLLITSALAFGISVYAYWQARRQRALVRSWQIGWSRAYRRRRVLQHTLVLLKEHEGTLDVTEARHGSMPASAPPILPGSGSIL